MVNEISGIGSTSVARGLVQAGTPESSRGLESTGQLTNVPEDANQVATRHVGFSVLATAKDEATRAAQSIRDANQALVQADTQLRNMEERVRMVKNYPPFPPGNEQRMAYINSINGLRRQLEAMTIPPVQSGVEPVFYPRETDLPDLDPSAASDADVARFGAGLGDARAKLDNGFRKLAEAAATFDTELAILPGTSDTGEPEVAALGETAGRQLAHAKQPISGQSMQLGYI